MIATYRKFPTELKLLKYEIAEHAKSFGLDFFDVIFEVVEYDEMNEIAAYGGFPTRYPHWRFGMEYEYLSKTYSYGLSKIYEMVINNDPCYAYLLRCNNVVDQKLVISHVFGHADFFKNNLWFAQTNRKMIDEIANHATRIARFIERYSEEAVEGFIDTCLSIEDLIDVHAPFIKRRQERSRYDFEEEEEEPTVKKLKSDREYMDAYINPPVFLEQERKKIEEDKRHEKKFPSEPERDILFFLIENAPLEHWQRDILSIIREESYYFAPQAQTKILNEGWACAVGETRVYTDRGLLTLGEIVQERLLVRVSDGSEYRRVYGWAVFNDRETVKIRTRRGFEIEGSLTHKVLMEGREDVWKPLSELCIGDRVRLRAGMNCWSGSYLPVEWCPNERMTLSDVAEKAGVNLSTVIRYRNGVKSRRAEEIKAALIPYDEQKGRLGLIQKGRVPIKLPKSVDEDLGRFLGYLIGDGNISEVKRCVGLTTGDEEQADRFMELGMRLFDLKPYRTWDGRRYRVLFYSHHLIDFLKHLGCKTGFSTREKEIPEVILRSPKSVVRAFLQAYFDADGYAGKAGVILVTSSEKIGRIVQLLLLNFGVLSKRTLQANDRCWHIQMLGKSAAVFLDEIGFGLSRKQDALQQYVNNHRWFKPQLWVDEVVLVERGQSDVYDISVEESHRYAAAGFINHNSFWHSKIMTEKILKDSEIIDYADHHSGTLGTRPGRINPYKLGIELFRDIEDRWNKGKFGKGYDECTDLEKRRRWDRQLGLGREKIFEVRRIYNDVGFIDEFLTEEFCREHRLFTYAYDESAGAYEIESRDFKKIKEKLLFSLTNFGKPFIEVEDGNYRNRGELYLRHKHDGIDLRIDHAKETLKNIQRIWTRPVHVETKVNDREVLLTYDGAEHIAREIGGARKDGERAKYRSLRLG